MVNRQIEQNTEENPKQIIPRRNDMMLAQPRRVETPPAFVRPQIPEQLNMTAREIVDAIFGTDRNEMVRAITCLRFHDGDYRFNNTVLQGVTRRLNEPGNNSALAQLFRAYREHVAAEPHNTPIPNPAPANAVQLWLNSLVGAPHTNADLLANREHEENLNRQAIEARRRGNREDARRLDEEGRRIRRPTGVVHNSEYRRAISAVVRPNGANLVPEFSAQMSYIQICLRQDDYEEGRIPAQAFNRYAPRYYSANGLNGYFATSANTAQPDRETGIALLALAHTLSEGVPRTTTDYGNGRTPNWPSARGESPRTDRRPSWATESDTLIRNQ